MSGSSGCIIYGQKQKEGADSNPLANTVSAYKGIRRQKKRTKAKGVQRETQSVFLFLFLANHCVKFVVDFGDGF